MLIDMGDTMGGFGFGFTLPLCLMGVGSKLMVDCGVRKGREWPVVYLVRSDCRSLGRCKDKGEPMF